MGSRYILTVRMPSYVFFFIRPSSFFLRILELQLMRSPSAEFLAVQIHETSFPI